MLVDSEAPPATPTAVLLATATANAAAIDTTSMDPVSSALTMTSPPPVCTLDTPTMLAVTSLSMVLCARARPMETAMAALLVLPEMLADAAMATASISESSLAVTLTAPSATTLETPAAAVSWIVASIVLSIVLKLSAPVAPTPTAVPPPLSATATPMPKASESISALLSAETVTAPAELSGESSTTARVVL